MYYWFPAYKIGSLWLGRELPIRMLISTHDMKLVEELFPRTIVMDEGVIVADGKTKDVLADAKLLEAHGLKKP